jgi:mannan endo-1,4-beta-mannosidase
MKKKNQQNFKERNKINSPFILAFIFLAAFNFCEAQQGFVKVRNTHFVINNKPYYYVGTNLWYGAYLGADAAYGNRPRLLRELDHLQKLGVNNLRVVAAAEESDFGLPLSPPFQYKNGTYNETLLQGLDFLLSEMGKRNLHAVLILNNYWDWSGGMSEYVSWATGERIFDPATNKEQTWDQMMNFSARFYKIEEAQKRYRKYINTIVNRKNIYTKKMYKNDPAIMTWELANEPRPSKEGDSTESVKVFSNWVNETAKYIHSIAPNQLVTTGSEGSKGTLNNLDFTAKAHSSKYVDYITFHMWPKNWGWYKFDKPEMEQTKEKTAQYFDEHLAMAQKLNKPIVMEEFGFVRDGEKHAPGTPITARDEYYTFVFQLLKDAKQGGKSLGGLNFWGWGGEGRTTEKDGIWKPGDITYTADPYSEAQGLNSVFNTDSTTLKIIAKYAQEINNSSSVKKK